MTRPDATTCIGLSLLAWCVLGLGAYWPRMVIMAASLALAWVVVEMLCKRPVCADREG